MDKHDWLEKFKKEIPDEKLHEILERITSSNHPIGTYAYVNQVGGIVIDQMCRNEELKEK